MVEMMCMYIGMHVLLTCDCSFDPLMIFLLTFLLFVLSNSISKDEEPPAGVERTLLNSESKRREFREKSAEVEKENAERDKIIAKWEKERQRKYRNKLRKMSPEEQAKRKDLKSMQEERIIKYKEGPSPMTKEEIKECTGYYPDLPVLLSVKGRIYDVSTSNSFKAGGGYSFFAGRDSSYAFATANFGQENLDKEDDLDGLGAEEMSKLNNWVKYFEEREDYYYVGPLIDYKYANSKDPRRNSKKGFINFDTKEAKPWL